MLNLLIIALIIAIAIFSVSAFSNEEPKEHNYIDDPNKQKLKIEKPLQKEDSVTDQQNYDKNDAGLEAQEALDPNKEDSNKTK
jgi:hypothetical protein